MKRGSPLVRQWTLLRMLGDRHAGSTVRELARELGVHDKMIRRDLVTFRSVAIPLGEIVEEFGPKRWRLDPKKTRPGLDFAFDEAVALYLGGRFLDPLAGTVFFDAAQRA